MLLTFLLLAVIRKKISRASEICQSRGINLIRFLVDDKYATEAKNQNKYGFPNAGSDGLVDTINHLLNLITVIKITNYYVVF